ncbi:ATP-binding protein [Romboutsia maritimum]|uniref:ATP-binding protein n=1 Tax=Romboutsia maritimum TaxID=2020948 RepID=A0A371IQS3_9FIRM|nr:sensor histidine kinase [Romboutsia maritimum]RDY22837.1 ATP-binding protein [Romboutsia maritimum]
MLNSDLFWNITIFISTIIEWIVFKFVLDELNEHKKDKLIINTAIILNIILITFLNIININSNIKLAIGISIGYIFYIYNYKATIFKGLIINLVYWMILVGVDLISVNIILMITEIDSISGLLKNNIFRLEQIVISKLLIVSIIPIVKNLKYNIELKKIEAFHVIIPIIANILSVVVIFTLEMESVNKSYEQKITLLIVSSILILSNISLIKIIGSIVKSNTIKMENKLIREKMDIQYHHYLTMQESQLKVRKLYHNMNNHIVCIKKLYKGHDDANIYIENLKNELNCWESVISTENMILDIIVNEKKNICNINNIDFDVDINFSKCEFIDMIDICSIFSNMIDNAIEACMKLNDTERFIRIKGTIVKRIFVVKCENSKINQIKLRKNKIITDKTDSFSHGLGIKSIKSSVQKYDGEVSVDFSKDKFVIQIYIPLR